jgi:hypothetical protein
MPALETLQVLVFGSTGSFLEKVIDSSISTLILEIEVAMIDDRLLMHSLTSAKSST